jgi:hypothetical protein
MTFELQCGPLKSLAEKSFQIKAMKFGQKLHKTHTNTQKKRRPTAKILELENFIITEILSHVAKCLFLFTRKHAKQ